MSGSHAIRTLASGVGFAEGPIISPTGDIFVTSIDQGRVYRVAESFAESLADLGGGANGATLAADGTIYVAQNGGRWARFGPSWGPSSVGGVQRVSPDGTCGWVTRDPIAPNDICFGPDGLLYLTDPTRAPRGGDGRIWRVDPETGGAEILLSVAWFPNGIGFGPDGALYVASTHDGRIVRFTLDNGIPVDPETVIRMASGLPDGFAFDVEGNLLIGALGTHEGDAGEVQVWSSEGELLDVIRPSRGRHITNVALSPDRLLIITDSDGGNVLAIDDWPTAGLELHPFRAATTAGG